LVLAGGLTLATAGVAAAADPGAGDSSVVPMMQYHSGLDAAKNAAEKKVRAAVTASNDIANMLSLKGPGAPGTAGRAAAKTAGKAAAPAAGGRGAALNTPHSAEERHLMNREVYVYKTVGRRDPFASLLAGEFETTVGSPLLDVSSMKLVGIVWSPSDKFALVEDGRGHGHVLRVGDPVINGYVVGLTKDELLVRQSSYGDSQTVTIQLQRKEGSSNEK
jgi:hypothetical protein